MHSSLIFAALAGLALAAPQAAPTTLAPKSSPSGCVSTYSNGDAFQLGIVNASSALKSKRTVSPNSMPGNTLMLTLVNGQLTDQAGRHGYVASNQQLQFDNPIQSGALLTAGWTACPNGTLALASDIWWECLTVYEGRSFFNLYDSSIGSQCSPAFLMIIPEAQTSSAAPSATGTASPGSATTTAPPSRTTGTPAVTTIPISQISDGQIQGGVSGTAKMSTMIVSQIMDGQVQAGTPPKSTSTTTSMRMITQITDGQIQAPAPTIAAAAAPANSTSGLTPFKGGASDSVNAGGFMTLAAFCAGLCGLATFFL